MKSPLAAQGAEHWSEVSLGRALVWGWGIQCTEGRKMSRNTQKKLKDFPSQTYKVQKTLEALQRRRVRLGPRIQKML